MEVHRRVDNQHRIWQAVDSLTDHLEAFTARMIGEDLIAVFIRVIM